MTEYKARRPKRPPTHPGEIWREDVFPELGLTVAGAARDMGISRQTLHKVLRKENPVTITPELALRFARLCGNDELAEVWVRMQAVRNLWEAIVGGFTHCKATRAATA